MSAIFGLIIIICLVLIYFLPTILANKRNHKNVPAIFVINFFLGWTLIGWVVALAWAVME